MFVCIRRAAGQLEPLSSQWRGCKEVGNRSSLLLCAPRSLPGGRSSISRVRVALEEGYMEKEAAPTPPAEPHAYFMGLALLEGAKAAALGEVPVGAVLVSEEGEVLAAAHNQVEATGDPTAHAEMLCLRQGAAVVGGWRLLGTTLYVTLEPCPMCAGALLQARVGGLVYGTRNLQLGADGSWISMLPGGQAERAGARPAAQQHSHGRQGWQQQQQRRYEPKLEGNGAGVMGGSRHLEGPQQQHMQQGGSSNAAAIGVAGHGGCHAHGAGCGCNAAGTAVGELAPHAVTHQSSACSSSSSSSSSSNEAGPTLEPAAGTPRHPYHPTMRVVRGVLEGECSEMMRAFFRQRRRQQQQ